MHQVQEAKDFFQETLIMQLKELQSPVKMRTAFIRSKQKYQIDASTNNKLKYLWTDAETSFRKDH